MSEEFCHVSVRSHSPDIVDPPPSASLEEGSELSQLVEDFMRATQLQISLKQRIDSYLERKEKEAEEEEEKARLLWVASQATKKARQNSASLLREKMKQAENMGKVNKETADNPPPTIPPGPPIASNEDGGKSPVRALNPLCAPPGHVEAMKPPPSPSVHSMKPDIFDSPPNDLLNPSPIPSNPRPSRQPPSPLSTLKESTMLRNSSFALPTASKATLAGITPKKSKILQKPSTYSWMGGSNIGNKASSLDD